MTGKVFLIGAGPGDAGLLTCKGAEVLASAEVVVYDRLVGRDVLAMMPAWAEQIDVGKQADNHPVPQERISEILLEKAQSGKRVVRLKGGDCFLFGRGGEELELLSAHGVPFEVVPGVPSPIAATAYAGIPVTHRDYCSSVHFITGHKKKGEPLTLDFDALVRLDGTLVFLMSVSNCGEIAAGLLAHGMPHNMPSAVIENGTRPNQRKFVCTIATLEQTVQENEVISPALLVVGRVCTLSDRFDWFDRLPLHGVKILITSPPGNGQRLKAKLDALGADVTTRPAIVIEPLPFAMPDLQHIKLTAFTSAAGVRIFFDRLAELGLDARVFAGVQVACVGTATAAALEARGIRADVMPKTFSGEALAGAIAGAGVKPGDEVLLVHPTKAAPALANALRETGVAVRELAVYQTQPLQLADVDPAVFDYLCFTSASGVESFAASCRQSGFTDFSALRALCIGPSTAAAAQALGMQVDISEKATLDSMVDYLVEASV